MGRCLPRWRDTVKRTAPRSGRIATIAVGYGDGFLRSASASKGKPAAEVIIKGHRCPIVGRVSMDLMTIDVTDVPEGAAKRGDLVTLIGDDLTVDEVARRAGTIGYEILTSLGRRYARRYIGSES